MENILQISKENAVKAYNKGSKVEKELIINLFGKDQLFPNDPERIKSYEDACKDQGFSPLKLSDFKFLPEHDQKYLYATHKVTTIIRSLNRLEDGTYWKPDFGNDSERKYYIWYKWVSSDVEFSVYDSGCSSSLSIVGSRLHFRTKDILNYFSHQFLREVNNYLTL